MIIFRIEQEGVMDLNPGGQKLIIPLKKSENIKDRIYKRIYNMTETKTNTRKIALHILFFLAQDSDFTYIPQGN